MWASRQQSSTRPGFGTGRRAWSAPRTRNAGSSQDLGRHTSVTPRAVANTAILAKLLGDLHEGSFQNLEVGAARRVELRDLRLEVADVLGGQHFVDTGSGL